MSIFFQTFTSLFEQNILDPFEEIVNCEITEARIFIQQRLQGMIRSNQKLAVSNDYF